VHLVGFTIEIYYDARSYKCQAKYTFFFAAYAWTVRGVKFQERRFYSCRDAAEKVICPRSKVALITYRSQQSLHRL
jgi:hypothetical protein